jgi:hypothetical protein
MIVTSPANYERTRARRFRQQGVKRRHRRRAERMSPGDGICWYVTGAQTFAATGAPDLYPWRVRVAKEKAVRPERGVPAAALVPKLAFVRKWPRASWHLAFQGNLHELPASDFALIARALASG